MICCNSAFEQGNLVLWRYTNAFIIVIIEVFKYGYENIDRNIFSPSIEERRTRGHGVTLAKKQCRLDIIKFIFSQRTVNKWNILLADCVGTSSVNMFKNKINIYLRRAGYT